MSFLTCFCDFPQKEHFSRSPPSPIRATYVLLELAGRQLPAQDRGLRASLPSHRLPNRVTEAACSTLPAKGRFSDPPKRACQGSASLACPGRPPTSCYQLPAPTACSVFFRLARTVSTIPYSLASAAVMILSRSMSLRTFSIG